MLWQKSPRLANWLIDQHKSIIAADAAGHGMRNRTYSLNNLTTVILDGGIPGNSHIYKRACELAEEAESIVLVSQYCPTAKLSRIIKSKPSIIYFNHPKNASLLNKLIISAGTATTNLKSLYEKATYLHAKFIIFTMPGGKKVAISGSHNFSYSGVIFGTREIAIETTDKTIISQLEAFVDTQVDG
jgi:cardiolipin synthase